MFAQLKMSKIIISVPKIAFVLSIFTSQLSLYYSTNSNKLAQDTYNSMQSIQGINDDYVELIDDGNKIKSKTHQNLVHSDYYDEANDFNTSTSMDHNNMNNIDDYHLDNSKQFSNNLLSNLNRSPIEKELLVHDLADKACRLDRGCQRRDRLNNTYMYHCTRYKLENLLSNSILDTIMHNSTEECDQLLDEFILLDEKIQYFYELFEKLLTRYNCDNGYSVKWKCDDCKRAYKDWLCATNLPYYMNGEQIKPCISFCERVEQRCPYLHPIAKGQYGGQPVFICRDPNIPFVPAITPDIPYSEPYKCYDLCHLSDNITELIIDSLSKYDYNKCPNKKSIAAEVHKDPLYCNPRELVNSNFTTTSQQVGQYSTRDHYDPNDVSITNSLENTNKKSNDVHYKKLIELQNVLDTYKNQQKTHSRVHHSPRRA